MRKHVGTSLKHRWWSIYISSEWWVIAKIQSNNYALHWRCVNIILFMGKLNRAIKSCSFYAASMHCISNLIVFMPINCASFATLVHILNDAMSCPIHSRLTIWRPFLELCVWRALLGAQLDFILNVVYCFKFFREMFPIDQYIPYTAGRPLFRAGKYKCKLLSSCHLFNE